MKKILSVMVLAAFVILTFSYSASADGIGVYVNNKKIQFDVPPKITDGRTLVPMRAIFEALGAQIKWDEKRNAVYAYRDDRLSPMEVTIGADYMIGFLAQTIPLDVPAVIENGRTLVPLRAVSEAFDCEVKWDEAERCVYITSADFIDYGAENITQTTVEAATPEEFLNSIGSNKRIILTAENYNLSDAKNINNPNLENQSGYDDASETIYIIKNVVNMTITGNAEITVNDRYADVLSFSQCGEITLSGLTVGHKESFSDYQCEGAVISFVNCEKINAVNCKLYGCGAFGIYANNVKNLSVTNCKIYDCTYTGIWLTSNTEANVSKTEIYDSNFFSGFIRVDNSKLNCTDCKVYNVECSQTSCFIDSFDDYRVPPSELNFENCTFYNNKFAKLSEQNISNNLKIEFNNCTFKNNTGSIELGNCSFKNCIIE